MSTCKNCNTQLRGSYCHICGQKADIKPINFQYVLTEIRDGLFQVNRGFFYTLKELFTRPGHSIREYIEGKRIQHFKPISFVLLIGLIYAILVHYFEWKTALHGVLDGMGNYEEGKDVESNSFSHVLRWMIANYQYSALLVLPIWALGSYLAYLRKPYNYFEHFILVSFLTGMGILMSTGFRLLASGVPQFEDAITNASVLAYAYYIWAYTQFFHRTNPFLIILQTLLSFIVFVILIMGIGILIGVIGTIFLGGNVS